VFVDADEALQLERRIARDARERGYARADVMYQWEHHVLPAYRAHLLPYRHHCDVVVCNEEHYTAAVEQLCGHVAKLAGLDVPLLRTA
jgi:uridine kinase